MSQSARVTSLDSLIDLKSTLCTFTAEALEALSSVEMEIQRALCWLEEQLKYWRDMVRRSEEDVFQAKMELSRRKMLKIGDRPPDCTEQEKALRLARARLEHAEDKVEQTRRWQRELPEAITDYEGPARQLGGILEADMPKADAFLERKIVALEEYIQLLKPQGESSSPGGSNPAKGATP